MKKKNLIKKLQLKKTQVSNLEKGQVVGGGSRFQCDPVDLSELETCYAGCGYTENCNTNYAGCNNQTNTCGTNNCGTNGCNPSGGISCPGYQC